MMKQLQQLGIERLICFFMGRKTREENEESWSLSTLSQGRENLWRSGRRPQKFLTEHPVFNIAFKRPRELDKHLNSVEISIVMITT